MKLFGIILIIYFVSLSYQGYSQEEMPHNHDVYSVSWKKDGPIIGIGLTAAAIGSYMLLNIDAPTSVEINGLDVNGIWAFDRGATNNFSSTAETVSDVILFSSLAIPFAIQAFDECKGNRKELFVISLETFLTISALTNIAKGTSKRFRPFNYNPVVGDNLKLSEGSRLSFFSGHVSHTSAFLFMSAQILTDMHPHWKAKKYWTWGLATTLPIIISYGRFLAGKHFPTDVITGYIVGAGVGLIIPRIHRNSRYTAAVGPKGIGVSINLN